MLPFLFGSSLPAGEPVRSRRNPLLTVHSPPLTRAGVGTWPLASLSGGRRSFPRAGLRASRALSFAEQQDKGRALHEVWAAPAISLVPVILFSAIVASPCPATASRSSLGPSITPLGAAGAVTDAWLCPGPRPTGPPAGLLNLLSETRPGSGATRRGGAHTDAVRPGSCWERNSCRCLALPACAAGWAVRLHGLACLNRSQCPLPAVPSQDPGGGSSSTSRPATLGLPRTLPLPLPNLTRGGGL